mmetsp:Transcript_4250/g.14864  ORF Transcript_4250/g.14864 Transcript_4250/m.14864 type:complete len:209 (+) Transcript_4250:573-1199(+)
MSSTFLWMTSSISLERSSAPAPPSPSPKPSSPKEFPVGSSWLRFRLSKTNGLTVRRGMGVVLHWEPLISSIMQCFCFASPSVREVCTVLPSWEMTYSDFSACTVCGMDSCSCPQITRSSPCQNRDSLMHILGEWCTRFWWTVKMLKYSSSGPSGVNHLTPSGVLKSLASLSSLIQPKPYRATLVSPLPSRTGLMVTLPIPSPSIPLLP